MLSKCHFGVSRHWKWLGTDDVLWYDSLKYTGSLTEYAGPAFLSPGVLPRLSRPHGCLPTSRSPIRHSKLSRPCGMRIPCYQSLPECALGQDMRAALHSYLFSNIRVALTVSRQVNGEDGE